MSDPRPPKSFLLSTELADYLVSHGTPPDSVHSALIAETAKLGGISVMQIAPEQGTLLTILTRLLDTLAALPAEATFDLAFIDADKPNYANYYEALLPHIRPNGAILVDNVLWDGRVVQPK